MNALRDDLVANGLMFSAVQDSGSNSNCRNGLNQRTNFERADFDMKSLPLSDTEAATARDTILDAMKRQGITFKDTKSGGPLYGSKGKDSYTAYISDAAWTPRYVNIGGVTECSKV